MMSGGVTISSLVVEITVSSFPSSPTMDSSTLNHNRECDVIISMCVWSFPLLQRGDGFRLP
jgi:hypothetical protein